MHPKIRINPAQARQRIMYQRRSRLTQALVKAHLKKKKPLRVRFSPQIKGEVFFRFPHATPVGSIIEKRGKRAPFTMANVEWISKRAKVTQTKLSIIWAGKIKFKGKRSPEKVIIKEILDRTTRTPHIIGGWKKSEFGEIISRLNQSKTTHPKMAHLIIGKKEYLIQESFLLNYDESKLCGRNNFFITLRPEFPTHRELLQAIVEQTAHLANAGLAYGKAISTEGREMIDVFNAFRKKNGKQKVLVQYLDALFVEPNKMKAWMTSTTNLLQAISSGTLKTPPSKARKICEKIIAEVGTRFGFGIHPLV